MPESKPEAITGEAVFTSYDGLRVEANGEIGFLTFESKPLEMRSEQIMAALPPSSSFTSAIFLQSVKIQEDQQWIVGLVRKISDFNKRPGILGACISISERNRDLSGVGTFLYDVLFPIIEDALSERWIGRPLPEKLNLLQGIPSRETHTPYKMKTTTELLHQVNIEDPNLHDIIEAGFKLIKMSPDIGRIVISPVPTKLSKPADKEFISSINASYQDALRRSALLRQRGASEQSAISRSAQSQDSVENAVRNLFAQEEQVEEIEYSTKIAKRKPNISQSSAAQHPKSMKEVLRRQEIIGQRLTRIEHHLNLAKRPHAKSTMPIDQALGSTKSMPDRLNFVVLLAGVGLAIILLLLFLVWFFLRSESPEEGQVDVEPISSSSQEAVEGDVSQPLPDDVIVDCANPKTLAEQTLCNRQE